MKLAAHIMLGLGIGCLGVPGARADDVTFPGNPYATIPVRNVFNLVPIPTNNPADEVKQPDPPAKITPNGIMKLFGVVQVLFKVATPARPGQPQQDQSYCLSEGDRQDGIEVIKIDEGAQVITFDNNGIVQKIPLVAVGDTGGGGPGGGPARDRSYHGRFPGRGPGGPGPGFGSPPPPPPSAAYGATPASDGVSPDAGTGPSPTSIEGAQAKLASILNDPNHLTPEAQVILMEAQRQQLQAQGDPTAVLIPPTEITDEVQGGSTSGDAAPGPDAGGTPPSP